MLIHYVTTACNIDTSVHTKIILGAMMQSPKLSLGLTRHLHSSNCQAGLCIRQAIVGLDTSNIQAIQPRMTIETCAAMRIASHNQRLGCYMYIMITIWDIRMGLHDQALQQIRPAAPALFIQG